MRNNLLSRIASVALALTVLLALAPAFGENANEASVRVMTAAVIEDSADMLKYGHIGIDIPADEFLLTFAMGEAVSVKVGSYGIYTVPVYASYDDVAAGDMLLHVVPGKSYVVLAINYGQIAVACGLIEKAPEGAETTYMVKEGVSFPIEVTISDEVSAFAADVLENGVDMLKYGHIDIDLAADDALTRFELGDIVTVELDEYGAFDVPVCASYDDVAVGEKLLLVVPGKNYVILAINDGQIAMACGLIEKAPEGAETTYVVKEGVTFPIIATITVKSAAVSEGVSGSLAHSNERTEYPALSDAQ